MRNKILNCCVVWGTVVGFMSITNLSTGTITTGSWHLNKSDVLPNDVNYGHVDIVANDSTGDVTFIVTAPNVYTTITNFGIQEFGFNYQNVTSAPNTWTLDLPTGWSQSTNQVLDSFGTFKVEESGMGDTRKDPLVFTITLPTASEAVVSNFAVLSCDSAPCGHVFFAAHIAGFTQTGYPGVTSHWVGGSTPIPEPMTLMFSLFGLGLLKWLKRRLT